jgi:TetR/AcrR family hemagglutinin/protease transcriptional regulator
MPAGKRLSRTTDKTLNKRGRARPAHGPNPGKRRRLSPAARRAELLEVALRVFARRGIGRATHAEIAAEAGCSLGTTFVYFPTREDLVAAVLAEVERFYIDMLRPESRWSDPAPDAIRGHVAAFTHSVASEPDHARIWLEWSASIREDIWSRYLAFQERIVSAIAATIERGRREATIAADIDSEDTARLLMGAAHMLAHMKFGGQSDEKIAHFVRTLLGASFRIRP